jgi:hypothetical protein
MGFGVVRVGLVFFWMTILSASFSREKFETHFTTGFQRGIVVDVRSKQNMVE